MQRAGFIVVNYDERNEPISMSSDELSAYQCDPDVKAIAIGVCTSLTYRQLCIASLYIQLNNALFIATNKDRYYTSRVPGRHMPAGGPTVQALYSGTMIEPILMGKPTTQSFKLLIEQHNLQDADLSKFIMVGDSLFTDIKFGNNCNIDTLLVLSGNTQEDEALEMMN